ncbi:MAG: iron uptake porin [Oculatellaceae cyanobacterium bins.114]|nr:iron uptake porin [Oculatellaceae cyanobacterium bins.114]
MLPKVLWNSLLVTPALLGAALISTSAIAADVTSTTDSAEALLTDVATTEVAPVEASTDVLAEVQVPAQVAQTVTQPAAEVAQPAPAASVTSLQEITQYSREVRGNSMAQVTSVSQLSDVQPTDWAFQALQSLVERYGCIAGYPDGTYRGNRAMTRYEFAAGMNACLDRVNELIAAGLADAVTREDLATLQRLQEEFAAELATLRGRVDALEARTSELEANQFSTTTVLRGRTIFSVSDIFGGEDFGVDDANNTVFQSRVRLNFDTSFTGEDRLRARLQAGNFRNFNNVPTSAFIGGPGIDTDQTDLSYDTNTTNYEVRISRLEYYFPLGDNITVYLGAQGESISDIVTTVSPFDDPEQGSLSYFGYNPIYDIGDQNIGAGATVDFTDDIQLGFGYLTNDGNDPAPENGLFNGDYTAFGQLTLTPGDLTLALTYTNSYLSADTAGTGGSTILNGYGVSANYSLNDTIQIGGWISYIDSSIFTGTTGEGDGWTYAGTLGFSDLGKEGSLLGFIVGVPPRQAFLETFGAGGAVTQEDAALHVEGFYRYPLTDNISITPGVIWLLDPGNVNTNDDIVIGVVRTSFSF